MIVFCFRSKKRKKKNTKRSPTYQKIYLLPTFNVFHVISSKIVCRVRLTKKSPSRWRSSRTFFNYLHSFTRKLEIKPKNQTKLPKFLIASNEEINLCQYNLKVCFFNCKVLLVVKTLPSTELCFDQKSRIPEAHKRLLRPVVSRSAVISRC